MLNKICPAPLLKRIHTFQKKCEPYLTFTLLNAYAFFLCVGMLLFAGYLQHAKGLAPCPLCVVQRAVIALLGILFFCGMLLRALPKLIYRLHAILVALVSLAGAGVAARQIYLQALPAGMAPACGPTLDYMLKYLPLSKTAELVFHGSGECAKVDWTFLDMSIAQWSLNFFLLCAIIAIINFVRIK